MSITRPIIVAAVLAMGSLPSIWGAMPARGDELENDAVARLEALGAKVGGYSDAPAARARMRFVAQPFDAAGAAKTVTFLDTNLTDLELSLATCALLQITNLKRLDLSKTKLKGESLGGLAGLASLEELDLSSTPLSGCGLHALSLLSHLRSLSLNNTWLRRDSFACLQSALAGQLTTLNLSGVTFVDDSGKPLAPGDILELIRPFSLLTRLDLAQTLAIPGSPGAQKTGVANLGPLTGLTRLNKLDLSNNNLKGWTMQSVARLEALTDLNLSGNKDLTDDCLAVLWPPEPPAGAALPAVGLRNLKTLSLSGTKLTDAGLTVLAERRRGLTELDLSSTPTLVKPDVAAGLGKLSGLTKLNLSGTGLNDAALRALWKDKQLPALKSLDVSATAVTNRGLAKDTAPPEVGFAALETLFASDTRVTAGGISRRNALLASLAPARPCPEPPHAAFPAALAQPHAAVPPEEPEALRLINSRMGP
jgi:Leucine-rich repeat (LRR) protein